MNITEEGRNARGNSLEGKLNDIKGMSKYTYIIDAGHGGMKNGVYQTDGKRSPIWEDDSQYFEGVGNRQIAARVGELLTHIGVDYCYTVNPNDSTDVDLDDRVEWCNKLPYKQKIGISIHSNGFKKESANGWEVWTSKGETTSDKIATVFYNRFQDKFLDRNFRSDTVDGDVDKESNFYILKYTTCPFILLENFFMTNEDECRNILMTDEGQEKIARAIVESITVIEKRGIPGE